MLQQNGQKEIFRHNLKTKTLYQSRKTPEEAGQNGSNTTATRDLIRDIATWEDVR